MNLVLDGRMERQRIACGDVDNLAGLRVMPFVGFAVLLTERAEADKLYLITTLACVLDKLQECGQDGVRVLLGQACCLSNRLHR